jgi:hypothetical protein
LNIDKNSPWPNFYRLAGLLGPASSSCQKERDQAHSLLIYLRDKCLLQPTKPSVDRPHRLSSHFDLRARIAE